MIAGSLEVLLSLNFGQKNKTMKKAYYSFIILGLLGLFLGCLEEVEIDTSVEASINIEEILIVEATLTDEMKNQMIILSRGSSFTNDSTEGYERDAIVNVIDDIGNNFSFFDNGEGKYVSETPFAAQEDVSYQLLVTTSRGEELGSERVTSSGVSTIDDIYAQRIISDGGDDGMAIFVDSSNPSGEFNNYRYNYEETYKIIAPNWTSREFEIIQEELEFIVDQETEEVIEIIYPDVKLVERKQEERVCYNTVPSNEILLSDGISLDRNVLGGNLVRFINKIDPILSHRYSILVRQFLQSADAANFYNTLLQFSQNANVFTEIQPGLIEGNVSFVNDPDAVVIGYFDVASVTERRLFFDYDEFFPGEELPPYFGTVNCVRKLAPRLGNPERDGPPPPAPDICGGGQSLIELIQLEDIEFFLSTSDPPGVCEGPYFVTQRECGDCTALGSNIVPEFWIE